jgi:hypothetical protein
MFDLLVVLSVCALFVFLSMCCAVLFKCHHWWTQWQVRRATRNWEFGPGGGGSV